MYMKSPMLQLSRLKFGDQLCSERRFYRGLVCVLIRLGSAVIIKSRILGTSCLEKLHDILVASH